MPWRRFILAVVIGCLVTAAAAALLMEHIFGPLWRLYELVGTHDFVHRGPPWVARLLGRSIQTVGITVFAATGIFVAAVMVARARRDPENRCRRCGYILRGISEPRCPECGERI